MMKLCVLFLACDSTHDKQDIYGPEDPYLFDDVTNELFGILMDTVDQESG